MNTYRILEGNALEMLRTLPADHVQAVVTSPPYFGLRRYDGLPVSWWGGDPQCGHVHIEEDQPVEREIRRGTGLEELGKLYRGGGKKNAQIGTFVIESAWCRHCAAWRGHLGLEPTPQMFVEHIVELFREVRRVLRPDGVLWLNMGDSYSNDGGLGAGGNLGRINRSGLPHGYKNKDLMMMPAEVAIALRNDGWYLRSEIVWEKSNPMPESVVDRPTKSHEMIYLLTKGEKYYFDQDAIREAQTGNAHPRGKGLIRKQNRDRKDGIKSNDTFYAATSHTHIIPGGRNARTVWKIATMPSNWDFCLACERFYEGRQRRMIKVLPPEEGSDIRRRLCLCGETDHWVDHFATFPERLVERCLEASTSEVGCCNACRAPYERVVEKERFFAGNSARAGRSREEINSSGKWAGKQGGGDKNIKSGPAVRVTTLGWRPTCDCPGGHLVEPVKKQVVLDPFSGSGTTGIVALRRHCDYLGGEASPKYVKLSKYRVKADRPLFNSLVVDVLPPAPAAPEPRLLHTADPAG